MFWKVRTILNARLRCIHARSYRDAVKLRRRFGGKIVGPKR